jgi:hypothetical protein
MDMQESIGRETIVTGAKSKGLRYGQKRAARLLVTGLKVTQVAKRLGERRKTIRAWREQPRFAEHEARLQAEIDACTQRRIKALVLRAVRVLEHMLKSSQPSAVRFAITMILKLNGYLPRRR